jgi:hypothetical protein
MGNSCKGDFGRLDFLRGFIAAASSAFDPHRIVLVFGEVCHAR